MITENAKIICCGNGFYEKFFNDVCTELEKGSTVQVYIDCIGHSLNNRVQEIYKDYLVEKYGNKLEIHYSGGNCSYSYYYKLTI